MKNDLSELSFQRVNHQKNESSLQKRQPSKVEDEKFHSQLDSSHNAAKLRMSSSDEKRHTFHTPVEFSWSQFWIAFIYENLPPVFVSPIAALLIERSFTRAFNVTQHRGLCVVSTKYNSLANIIISWVIVYPSSWLITVALTLRLFGYEGAVQNVDLFQMILAYLFLFMRRLIISVKYGYFRPEDIVLLSHPAPSWDDEKTSRRLVGAGWSNPAKYPGLIEDELTCAMDENDLSLQGITFKLDENVCNSMKNHPTNELFTAEKKNNKRDEVNSGFILHQILRDVYNIKLPPIFNLIPMLCAFSIALFPIFLRMYYGLDVFGETFFENIIFAGCFLGFVSGIGIMNFGFICAFDFKRRFNAMNRLGELINFPGIPTSEFLFHIPKKEIKKNGEEPDENLSADIENDEPHKNSYIFIDLKKRSNVFAWMNCRKTLRSFGEGFYLRIQGYTSILLMYSFFCVAILNVIAWMQMRHHVSTIFLIMIIVIIIASISIFSISKATKLQHLSSSQRDLIRKEIFLQEEEIGNSESEDKDDKELRQLRSAKALLEQVDESINFNDLIHNPTRVLGYVANQNVIGSALGIIATGCFLAIEGFSGSGISYDQNGWFNF
jgi:hypothetical protein